MGGPDAVVEKAQVSFDAGDYRWVCEVLNHVVFGFPDHEGARQLQSDSYEQLGYQSESTIFRNAYLLAAQELRSGPPAVRDNRGKTPPNGAGRCFAARRTANMAGWFR